MIASTSLRWRSDHVSPAPHFVALPWLMRIGLGALIISLFIGALAPAVARRLAFDLRDAANDVFTTMR
jgi:hypothetical protein